MSRRQAPSLRAALPALLLSLFCSTGLLAQQGTLAGIVTNEAGAPVDAAQIEVRGGAQGTGTLSDGQGRYRISLAPGTFDLVVTAIGHRTTALENVRVSGGETTTLDITLPTQAEILNPLNVTVSRSTSGGGERAVESVATTDIVTSLEISERASPNMADHLRGAPGVDVITYGMQSSNVVVRGFNNIFSGALHMLSDYRLSGVPSLRVNLMHFIPTTEDDLDRIEVVLGPGSALYGPNTANGVVHMITKSPLSSQGTTMTMGGGIASGNPSAVQGSFRSAFLLNENLGFKLSGQYMTGNEWEYSDPEEQAARAFADGDPAFCQTDKVVRGLSMADAAEACGRIGVRDFDLERYSFEARADWRFTDDGTFVATYGRNNSSGIELTGLGAGQVNDWVYDFFQGRVTKDRFFAQAYYNTSDAGNSWLLGDGVPLVDNSSLFVAQAQHGFDVWDGRQDFTYGVDFFGTSPDSRGSIYGTYEAEDEMEEFGVYLQSKTALAPKFDLVLAGRVDTHSVLPDAVVSPRAAVVFKPDDQQSFRLSYNRAFSTPSALNYFLDISGGLAPDPLSRLGFTTRAFGSGREGWSLRGPDGTFEWMRSPLTPAGLGGPAQLLPADIGTLWQYYVEVLAAGGAPAGVVGVLQGLSPSSAEITPLAWDTNGQGAAAFSPLATLDLPDMTPTLESTTETFEVGWTGVLNNRVAISADVYYTKKHDFVSPLLVQTPLVTLSPAQIEAYLTPVVGAAAAAGLAAPIVDGNGAAIPVPLGVVSSNDVAAQAADLILSYRNVGDVNMWGGDISVQAFLTDQWTVSGAYSFINHDYFTPDDFDVPVGSPIALNAPKNKGSLGLAFREATRGVTASARVRFNSQFPAESAGYVGVSCLPAPYNDGGLFGQDCVDSSAIVDITAGYKVPGTRATLQLSVTNVLDSEYRSFVGVPAIGRFSMLRVKYDLF